MNKQKQILPQQKKVEQVEETAEKFFKLLEAGDLAFFDLIKYALVVFGVTKIGKTTLCHHLNNNSLQGYKDTSGEVRYKTTQKNDSSAKIGQKTDSQTEIPNQFTTTIQIIDKINLKIIDTPGLRDSFGINRILSNAFFHYQVYSKVENMKLLIVLDGHQTTSPFGQFQITMKNYFRTFKNYKELQEKLLKATAVVITKAKPNNEDDKHQKMVEKYEKILELAVNTLIGNKVFNNDQWLEYLKRFLNYMKKNKKIFIFRQAKQGKPPSQKLMLEQIHKKTDFFSRKIDKKKQNSIDMSEINFSSAALLEKMSKDPQQKAKKIFDELKIKSLDTIKNLITLLRFAEEYTLQSINSPSLGKFSELSSNMNRQNNKIINLLKEQIKLKYQFIVDKRYNQKRIEIKKKINQQFKQFDNQHQKLWTTSLQFAYIIFKFIIKNQDYIEMNFQFLATIKVQILNLLKWMSLFFNQKNKQFLHKYHYCIHRFFQEIHIMLLIANKQDSINVDHDNPMLKIIKIFQTIPNKIHHDFFIEMENNSSFNYILEDPNNFFVNFLQKNGNLIIQSKLKEDKIIGFASQFQLTQKSKMFFMLMKFNYIQREFEKLQVKEFQQKYIKMMVNTLIQFSTQLKEKRKDMKFKDNQDLRQKFTQIQISVWTILGNILLENSKIKCENSNQQQRISAIIQIHKLIFNVTQVIRLFQNNIKRLQKQNHNDFVRNFKDKHNEDEQIQIFIQKKNLKNQKIIQEKIKFAQYLNSIGRSSHALVILQQAYSLIKNNPQQRKRISQMIALIGLGKDKPISEGSYNYYSKLANKEFILNPTKNLSRYLKQLKDENSVLGTIFDPQYRKQLKQLSPKKNNSTSSNKKESQAPQPRNSI